MKKIDAPQLFIALALATMFAMLAYTMWTLSRPPASIETRDFYQYVDEDAGVVCYVLTTGEAMSCLWLHEEPK